MRLRKVKAGALQLTLFIAVVIALLLTAFILLVHTHKRFQIQTNFIVETTKSVDKGFEYALQNQILLNDTISIELDDEEYKSLKLNKDFWGVFEKVTSVSQIKNNRFQKVALIGSKQDENNRTALYLQDNNKPLNLVGNTKIEGTAYVPKQGVRPGIISGQSYYGSQLIYGPIQSSSTLPLVFSETIHQLKSIENQGSDIQQQQFLTLEPNKQYRNSFFNPVLVVFSNTDINLNSVTLIGNIRIQSKTKIIVDAFSNLKDVLLIAPEIEILDNVKGNFQAIASKKISVGTSVTLDYPSALVVNEKVYDSNNSPLNEESEQNSITINDNTTIKGLVMFYGKEKPNNFKSQIEIKENATVYGEIYNNQNTELRGTVFGTVYTNNFIANQFGSIFQNHIYNGTIVINELPEEYVGLAYNNSKKGILKWLY